MLWQHFQSIVQIASHIVSLDNKEGWGSVLSVRLLCLDCCDIKLSQKIFTWLRDWKCLRFVFTTRILLLFSFQEDPRRSSVVLGCIDQYAHKVAKSLQTNEKKTFDAPNVGEYFSLVFNQRRCHRGWAKGVHISYSTKIWVDGTWKKWSINSSFAKSVAEQAVARSS